MVAADLRDKGSRGDCIVVETQTRQIREEVWVCEEGITTVEDLFCFFIDLPRYSHHLRIEGWVSKQAGRRESRYEEQLVIDLIANLAREIHKGEFRHNAFAELTITAI